MASTQIVCFFSQGVFLWQVFSGLPSNRTSIVSSCSAPVVLLSSYVLAFFTCTIFLYFGPLVDNSSCLIYIICFSMGFLPNVVGTQGMFVHWVSSQQQTPQPYWRFMFWYCDFRPKLWTLQPNWHDMFVHRVFFLPKQRIPQPNWLYACVRGFSSKVVDTSA